LSVKKILRRPQGAAEPAPVAAEVLGDCQVCLRGGLTVPGICRLAGKVLCETCSTRRSLRRSTGLGLGPLRASAQEGGTAGLPSPWDL
jgi:hypothetical protein